MNSNMVKPETFDHLHLVYDFTVPLRIYSVNVTKSAVFPQRKFHFFVQCKVNNLFLLFFLFQSSKKIADLLSQKRELFHADDVKKEDKKKF